MNIKHLLFYTFLILSINYTTSVNAQTLDCESYFLENQEDDLATTTTNLVLVKNPTQEYGLTLSDDLTGIFGRLTIQDNHLTMNFKEYALLFKSHSGNYKKYPLRIGIQQIVDRSMTNTTYFCNFSITQEDLQWFINNPVTNFSLLIGEKAEPHLLEKQTQIELRQMIQCFLERISA